MKVILNNGMSLIIDSKVYKTISHLKISCQNNNGRHYAYTSLNGKKIYIHRLITGAKKGFDVDHINGNGLDNRLKNLRICTRSQNAMNKNDVNPKSGFKGVYWGKNRWRVEICKDYKKYRVNGFKDLIEAAKKYDELAILLHGEFASLNFKQKTNLTTAKKEEK